MPTRLGKLALITFLFSILFSLTISAHAYVWYVDGNQAISGNGTSWFEAFKTIQEAVPWAVGSDEIWVRGGISSFIHDQSEHEDDQDIRWIYRLGGRSKREGPKEQHHNDRWSEPTPRFLCLLWGPENRWVYHYEGENRLLS